MSESLDYAQLNQMLPVVEKFISINGEGQNAGKLAAFIRFPGCNLQCSYCDTIWANEIGVLSESNSIAQLVDFVLGSGVCYVTLTGGEPTLQPALGDLIDTLLQAAHEQKRTLYVEVETNGSTNLATLCLRRREWIHCCSEFNQTNNDKSCTQGVSFTMDYKLPSSGAESSMNVANFELLTPNDTVKFVAGSMQDLARMDEVIRTYDLCSKTSVYVSPAFGEIDPADIVEFLKENNLTNVTLQLQLHKIIWPNADKGV